MKKILMYCVLMHLLITLPSFASSVNKKLLVNKIPGVSGELRGEQVLKSLPFLSNVATDGYRINQSLDVTFKYNNLVHAVGVYKRVKIPVDKPSYYQEISFSPNCMLPVNSERIQCAPCQDRNGNNGPDGQEGLELNECYSDPILIDLGQDGIKLGEKGVGVYFDMAGKGNYQLMQWVRSGGNDAFLVSDLNGNGIVDNGTELFGETTKIKIQPKKLFSVSTIEANKAFEFEAYGFNALAKFDRYSLGGNEDGYISAEDEVWLQLSLWLDSNADGISAENEMMSLENVGISHLTIETVAEDIIDNAGNRIPFWSWAINYNNDEEQYKMVDVFFKLLESSN